MRLDCAALGYGPATALVRPRLEVIDEGILLSYHGEGDDSEKRYDCLVVFTCLQDGHFVDMEGVRVSSSNIANIRPDFVWMVLVEPTFADFTCERKAFIQRLRRDEKQVRFMALDAFLLMKSSIVRGFIDSPHAIAEDERLEDEVFLAHRMVEYFNESIVGALRSATVNYNSVWALESK